MKNQLQMKAATLAAILDSNRLTKESSQTITHKSLTDQTSLGREQTEDVANSTQGVLASTGEASNDSKETVKEQNNAQSLNTSSAEAIKAGGRKINTQTEDGNPSGDPATQAKIAASYRERLSQIMASPETNQTKQTGVRMEDFRTGTEVLAKFASLVHRANKEDIAEAEEGLIKLASTNPVFHICKERILMSKMAEDIQALAEAEGISEEEAAANLQEAAEADPAMLEELNDEANGEALVDLAGAEEDTAALMEIVDGLAMRASETSGQEVSPDDILSAADEVIDMAEEMGIEPEELMGAALDQMQGGGEEGAGQITEEDEMEAQMILEEAAQMGISPEEVIQMAAAEMDGGAVEEPVEKVASLQKRAGTNRAAYVQSLRNRRDGK